MEKRDASVAVLGFVALSFLWGTQFLVIREGQVAMPALLAVSLRFTLLALAGATAARLAKASAPEGTLRVRALFGFAQALSFGLLYVAQKNLDSGLAGLLSATTPLFVAVLAHLFVRGERLRPETTIALILGFGGSAMLVISSKRWGTPAITIAMALVLFGELAGATNKILGKGLVTHVPSSVLLRDMGAIVAVTTGLAWLVFERAAPVELSARAVAAFSYLGLVASFGGSALYMRLLRILPVTTLGYLQFATALVASTTGVIVGGEHFAPNAAFAALAILAGLVLLAWSAKRERRPYLSRPPS